MLAAAEQTREFLCWAGAKRPGPGKKGSESVGTYLCGMGRKKRGGGRAARMWWTLDSEGEDGCCFQKARRLEGRSLDEKLVGRRGDGT